MSLQIAMARFTAYFKPAVKFDPIWCYELSVITAILHRMGAPPVTSDLTIARELKKHGFKRMIGLDENNKPHTAYCLKCTGKLKTEVFIHNRKKKLSSSTLLR